MLTFIVTLSCDKCSCSFVLGSKQKNITGVEQRKLAAELGWIYTGSKDYCLTCRPKTKTGYNHPSKKKDDEFGLRYDLPPLDEGVV